MIYVRNNQNFINKSSSDLLKSNQQQGDYQTIIRIYVLNTLLLSSYSSSFDGYHSKKNLEGRVL